MSDDDHADTTPNNFTSLATDVVDATVVQSKPHSNKLVACRWILVRESEIMIACRRQKIIRPI
jgi:hypothetical protein